MISIKGVSVNVISMEGTDCKLALLGRVAGKFVRNKLVSHKL